MNEYYDVIIVGTGAAGLYCALMLSERKKILMLTKQEADLSDSFLAQGGICMLRGEDDYKDYFEDKMCIRDRQIPFILVKQIYACASLAGAGVCIWLMPYHKSASMILGAVVVVIIRILAATYRWDLPKIE